MKLLKWKYDYEALCPGERQYDNIDLNTTKVVDAKYIKSDLLIDRGNPLIEALPLPRITSEVRRAYDIPLFDFDAAKMKDWNVERKKRTISSLRYMRLPLPFHYELEDRFYEALVNSYRSRCIVTDNNITIKAVINQKEELLHSITIGEDGDAANSGFTLLGYSGCGKSSSLKILLNHYPQVIYHHPAPFYNIPQITYIVVNCVPNSNFSALYTSIGTAIDRALGNVKPIYEKMISEIRTLGKQLDKVRELVEKFSIGMIILDEIQLIDFSSTKENSFESFMTLCNRTKVAISVIGTEDAYNKMFKELRTSRRTGSFINANAYCDNRIYFKYIVKSLFNYQWFDKQVQPTEELIETLFNLSRGIIDQVIGIYMFMQLDYLEAIKKPDIDKAYIENVARRHYPGLQKILKEFDLSISEKQRLLLAQNANKELDKIFEDKQSEFTEVILQEKPVEDDIILSRVISNIQACHDEYSPTSIINAYNKVLNIKGSKNKNESELTKLTVKMLLGKNINQKTGNSKKTEPLYSNQEMVNYIES